MLQYKSFHAGFAERIERVRYVFTLKGSELPAHEKDLQSLTRGHSPSGAGPFDEVEYTYTFNLAYFNGIVAGLQAIQRLADAGVVVKVYGEELNHAESLLLELHEALTNLKGA